MIRENRERLDRTFGRDAPITLVFVCRRESEFQIFRSVADMLFGGRLTLIRKVLPEGVHGSRKTLDNGKSLKRRERADIRAQAWAPLAEQILAETPAAPVIVQAERVYDRIDEDGLNKDVGRNTLARIARANVQYLLPPEPGKASHYLHRAQAALYDLLFAHAGLGPQPATVVGGAFPIEASRPKTILGIFVASQAASIKGRPNGAELVIAAKIDVATGRIYARIGYLKGSTLETTDFETLDRTLPAIASSGATSLGEKQLDRKRNFIAFLRRTIDDVARDDPKALVMVDATYSKGFWPWLSDKNISSEIFLDNEADRPPMSWKGLRFVRIREKTAGRIAIEKKRRWIPIGEDFAPCGEPVEDIYATAIPRLAESLPEGNARARHYLCAHGFDVRNQGARGQSVYHSRAGFQKAGAKTPPGKGSKVLFLPKNLSAWDKPSRIPITLEITVVPSQMGDDEDAVASLVSSLRSGYSHTVDGTTLPAPLSFRSKIFDYMDRYGPAPEADEDEPVENESEGPADTADIEPQRSIGQLRKWFEGTADFSDEDIPDYESEYDDADDEYPHRFYPQDLALPEEPLPASEENVSTDIAEVDPLMNETSVAPPDHNDRPPEATPDPERDGTSRCFQKISINPMIDRLRSPSLTLPSFVDEAYITDRTIFVNSDVRRIHEHRQLIRDVTGYPWPEEKPANESLPRILLEALRYPAFVIAFQPQWFARENKVHRTFVKRSVVTSYWATKKQTLKAHPLPFSISPDNFIRVVLHTLDHGANPEFLRDELFWLAAIVAWGTPCNIADRDLQLLIDRGGVWAEIGNYLRSIVQPFVGMGDLTIGDVFQRDIIRLVRETNEKLSEKTVDSTPQELDTTVGDDELTTMQVASVDPIAANDDPDELAGVLAAWKQRSQEMRALSSRSVETGPDADILTHLRSTLKALEDLKEAAERLTPKSVCCATLVAELSQMIDEIEAALTELVGPTPDATQIRSDITLVGAEANPNHYAAAKTARDDAQAHRSRASEIAREIEELDASGLPMRARLAQSGILIDEQEKHLRNAMSMIGVSVRALIEGSVLPAAAPPIESIPQPALPIEPIPQPAPDSPAIPAPVPPAEAGAAKPTVPPPTSASQEDAVLGQDDVADPDYEPDQPLPVLAPPQAIPPEPEPESPLGHEVLRCLDHLFILGEFGLAHHLATVAERLIPEFDTLYDPAEFRLAAAAGRSLNLDAFELQSLQDARGTAIAVAQDLENKDDDRSVARRILLLAGSLPAALLRPDDNSALTLLTQIGDRAPLSHYHAIFQVLDANRKRGYPVTAANLAAATALSDEATFVSDAVAEIKATIDQFRSVRISFQPGERVKAALTAQTGILGELARELDHNARQTVDWVADLLADRDAIVNLLADITIKLGDKLDDGPARHRIINALSRIGQQCADLHQSLEQMQAIRQTATRLETLERLRSEMLSSIDQLLSDTETPSGGPLVDAANAHARRILENLQSICRGRATERNQAPLAVALHSPLLWIPNLTWTGGWTPFPYDDPQILNAILAAPTPRLGDAPAKSWKQAFQARKAECAFVPAKMLLAVANWHGVTAAEISASRDELAADAEARKANVRARIEKAQREIDRMRRMAVGTLDQAARLTEALVAINVEALPAVLNDAFLPEAVAGDRIVDFNIAQAKLDEIEREVTREFERERAHLSKRIEQVCAKKNLDRDTRQQLVNLLDRSEFTTLSDWVNILDKGEGRKPRLPTGTLNNRLAFFQQVLHDLAENNQNFDILTAKRPLEAGSTYRLINYSRPDQVHREDSVEALNSYLALKRAAKSASTNGAGSIAGSPLPAQTAEVISNLFYNVTGLKEDPLLTARRQSRFVFDAKIALPHAESTSLVLPEFGSSTNGAWRICIVSSAISNSDLIQLANDVGSRGVLVLVTGVLLEDRRTQIRTDLIRKKRSILIIDETMLAVAFADPDDRRRALVEMAQGYSYANPYKDHARAAVPPEMFKGRTDERSAIIDQTGSYIVFGGRRLGKTALLRHIVAEQPAHAKYTYVDLFEIQHAADAFDRISEKIGTEIFKAPVRGSTEFATAITTWLDGDERRRLLLLIDEADKFVRSEAETANAFKCIEPMLKLMADTKNRFKFVLAGLHNVSRIVRAENSPLVQISNSPLQIGPLVERDVDDAEFLVRGPLAAMGYEFESREDVWRILRARPGTY